MQPVEIVKATLSQGGGTFGLFGQPKDGYAVAIKGYEKQVDLKEFGVKHVLEFYHENRKILQNPEYHLGTWVHKGKVYLDISQVLKDEPQAKARAIARGEKAYFGLKELKEYYVA